MRKRIFNIFFRSWYSHLTERILHVQTIKINTRENEEYFWNCVKTTVHFVQSICFTLQNISLNFFSAILAIFNRNSNERFMVLFLLISVSLSISRILSFGILFSIRSCERFFVCAISKILHLFEPTNVYFIQFFFHPHRTIPLKAPPTMSGFYAYNGVLYWRMVLHWKSASVIMDRVLSSSCCAHFLASSQSQIHSIVK